MKEVGFVLNHTSVITSPPWQNTSDEDPYINQQYALNVLDIFESWEMTEGSNEVIVAVIDTGIDILHNEFIGRISNLSYNAVTETIGLEAVVDDQGHGTMVSGIIAAVKNNRTGIAGITSNVKVMAIKANASGEDTFKDSALIEGIYYAVDNGADIINLSLGSNYPNPLVKDALDYAETHGVIVVAASGNDGNDEAFYPAAFPSTISVSSIGEDLSIAEYSNFGETIDISAPGSDIITTIMNNSYGSVSGTSFAAPQVVGALALMLSYFPDMSAEEITQRFLLSAVDYGAEGYDQYYGFGIANSYQALTNEFAKITFETFSGTTIEPLYQLVNTTLNLPEPPKLEDYAFMGWYKDSEFTQPWDLENDLVTEDTTLYAKFNKEYHEVTFIANGIIQNTLTVKNGDTFALPTASLENHHFIGWTLDIENLNPYESSPLYSNLTLYAHFEAIVYYDISLYIDHELVDIITVEKNTLFNLESYEKIGHDFDGWYEDDEYINIYDESKLIETDKSIYARFIPKTFTVSLIIDNEIYDTIEIEYNQIPNLPTPTKDNSHFIDWYLEEEFLTVYKDSPITKDLSLYAYFDIEAYSVTYHINDDSYTEWHKADDLFEPSEPTKEGYLFSGWFYDIEYLNLYEVSPLSQNLEIYGFFELEYYQIIFYDYDQETILYEALTTYGKSVLPPSPNNLPDSISFTYSFSHWSEPTDYIKSDLAIYPVYNKEYIEGSIQLEVGKDTIVQGEAWNDGGITELDDFLTVETTGTVDINIPGKYTINYIIYAGDEIVDAITRIIRVTAFKTEVSIELNPGVTTISIGTDYQEAGASSEYGEVTIDSNVDTTKAGIYLVRYFVEADGKIYEKQRYVHVVEENPIKVNLAYWYREDDDFYVA
jgi:uncharacterized repeat protein (TIGR02543 family)